MVALAQKGLEDLGVTKDSRIAAFVTPKSSKPF
jgi:hypothetical protein